jgi:hypothetical protein
MGYDAESLKFKVTTGRPEIDDRKPCNFKRVTLQSVTNWIDGLNMDPQVKEELKKKAERYPQAALPTFVNNYKTLVGRIRKKLREESEKVTQLQTGEKENASNEKSSKEDTHNEVAEESGQEECNGSSCSLRYSSPSDPGIELGQSAVDPWESPCADEDSGGRSDVHPDVPDAGCCGGGLGGECDGRMERGEGDSDDAGNGDSSGLRILDATTSGLRSTDTSEEWTGGSGDNGS